MQRFLPLLLLASLLLSAALGRSLHPRRERDVVQPVVTARLPATHRQLGSGLSALGTLVSPLLFLMGMGSFISMLPQMFQTVLSGVGSNLIQSLIPGGAGNNPSSFRLRRTAVEEVDRLEELARRINQAVLEDGRLR